MPVQSRRPAGSARRNGDLARRQGDRAHQDRAQRSVLVRQRQEVQALSRGVSLPQPTGGAALERVLEWDGCLNVRDLGGLRTRDGRTVRWAPSSVPTSSAG